MAEVLQFVGVVALVVTGACVFQALKQACLHLANIGATASYLLAQFVEMKRIASDMRDEQRRSVEVLEAYRRGVEEAELKRMVSNADSFKGFDKGGK